MVKSYCSAYILTHGLRAPGGAGGGGVAVIFAYLMYYPNRFSLLNYLKARRVTEGAGSFVYFKVHEKKETYLLLDEQQQELGTTNRDAFLLYLTTYVITLVEEDADGYQLWKLRLDSLANPRDTGGMTTSFIRR